MSNLFYFATKAYDGGYTTDDPDMFHKVLDWRVMEMVLDVMGCLDSELL